jgi:hypothetical protein
MKNFLKYNLMDESTKMEMIIFMGQVEWQSEFYNMDSSNENY